MLHLIRKSVLAVAATGAAVVLAACGGGSGSSPSAPSGVVAGKVLSVDDSSAQVAGVGFVLLETGEQASSAGDGSFQLTVPPGGPLTLALATTVASHVAPLSDDDSSTRLDDDEVRLPNVAQGESVRIEVRLRNGRIVEARTSRSSEDRREAESALQRAATSDDANIEGKVEVERRPDREKIEFEVDHATPGRTIEFFVVDSAGAEISQGVATVTSLGEAELELSTNDGDMLPLGATRLEELEGLGVVYKDAGSHLVLLTGSIPTLPAGIATGGGETDGGDDVESRGRLTGTGGIGGYIEVERDEGEEEFDIEVDGLAPGTQVTFWLETAVGSNTYAQIGTRTAHSGGEAELEFDTDDGDTLPGGAASLADLAGRRVEVRDSGGGGVLASGVTPQL